MIYSFQEGGEGVRDALVIHIDDSSLPQALASAIHDGLIALRHIWDCEAMVIARTQRFSFPKASESEEKLTYKHNILSILYLLRHGLSMLEVMVYDP